MSLYITDQDQQGTLLSSAVDLPSASAALLHVDLFSPIHTHIYMQLFYSHYTL